MQRGHRLRTGGTVLVLLIALAAGRCSRRSDVTIDRVDVALNVLTDGSIEVEERFEVRLGSSGVTDFHRTAPVWHHDGVFSVSGSMDGKELPLEAGRGPALDATWHFSPTTGPHTFVLKYRAANAVEVSGIRGTVSWRAIEGQRDADRAISCVTLAIPESAVIIENPGFEESGLKTTTEVRNGQDAMCAVVPNGGTLTRRVTFAIDTMAVGEPQWQYFRRRSVDLMPAFVTTGLCLVVVGAGIIALVRFRYPNLREQPEDDVSPPLKDSLAQALRRGRPYGYELDNLIDAGLIDRERADVARDLWRAGIATLAFACATGIFTARWLSQFDVWPYAIPVSIVCCGILFLREARLFSMLSQKGVNARARVLYSARVPDGRTSA